MALVTISADFGRADETPVTGTVLIRPYVASLPGALVSAAPA